MVFSKNALLNELSDRIDLIRKSASAFSSMHPTQLKKKPGDQQWSIIEIFDHLNISHGIYLRTIAKKMDNAPLDQSDLFKPGWLGNWLYQKTLPGENGQISRMRTPGFLQPKPSDWEMEEIFNTYYNQLDELEDVVERARRVNIQQLKVTFAMTGMLQLRLGDNLRMMVAHHERHLLQANKVAALFNDDGA